MEKTNVAKTFGKGKIRKTLSGILLGFFLMGAFISCGCIGETTVTTEEQPNFGIDGKYKTVKVTYDCSALNSEGIPYDNPGCVKYHLENMTLLQEGVTYYQYVGRIEESKQSDRIHLTLYAPFDPKSTKNICIGWNLVYPPIKHWEYVDTIPKEEIDEIAHIKWYEV